MGKSYVRIIQAIVLGAAILGLLLSTPSLEARTTKKKSHHKKMKIVFDGSAPAAPSGDLGDEIVQPRAANRQLGESGSVVHLRGSSVDELFAKSKSQGQTIAKKVNQDDLDNPDLIDPSVVSGGKTAEAAHSSKPTTIAGDLSADESALSSFRKSKSPTKAEKRAAAKAAKLAKAESAKQAKLARAEAARQTKLIKADEARAAKEERARLADQERARIANAKAVNEVFATTKVAKAETINPLPAPVMEFDEPKAAPSRANPVRNVRVAQQAPPQSKIYVRDVQPVARPNAIGTRLAKNEPSEFKFNLAFENTTSMGRKYELETAGGRNYMMKNELFIGAGHSSGWGAKVSLDYIATSNDDSSKDIREMGDPSLIAAHPSLYKSVDVNIFGQGRYYLPVASDSRKKGLQHFAYSLFADLQLVEGLALHNDLTGRYYLQSQYALTDAFALIEDHTEIGKRFDWFRLGVGQRTQVESHESIAPGSSVELYPFADLLAISNTVLSARMYIPMLANGLVNGAPGSPSGPTGAGFSNSQFEFSARLSF